MLVSKGKVIPLQAALTVTLPIVAKNTQNNAVHSGSKLLPSSVETTAYGYYLRPINYF